MESFLLILKILSVIVFIIGLFLGIVNIRDKAYNDFIERTNKKKENFNKKRREMFK